MGLFSDQKNVKNVDSFDCLDENNNPKEFDENVMDLVFILDKSGSMDDLVEDTIGGFNSYIKREKDCTKFFYKKLQIKYENSV